MPKSNWYENRWKSLRREKCPLPRPPQKAALKKNKKGEKAKKGREMRRYERTRTKLGKKRIEKKREKKKNQGWRVSVGWNFPCPTAPHPPSFEHRGRRDKKKEQKAEAARRAHARTRLVRACYRWHAWYARASRRGKLCSRFLSNLHPCTSFNTRNFLVQGIFCPNSSRTGVRQNRWENMSHKDRLSRNLAVVKYFNMSDKNRR